jgi:hypothetical protein
MSRFSNPDLLQNAPTGFNPIVKPWPDKPGMRLMIGDSLLEQGRAILCLWTGLASFSLGSKRKQSLSESPSSTWGIN